MILCRAKPPKNQGLTLSRPRMTETKSKKESGSAIIWVFVMIGLVSALYFVFSNGFRAGESNLSREKVDLIVTEMLDYAELVKRTVQTMRINGCEIEGGFSFYSDQFADPSQYIAPPTPVDSDCHLFSPNGGGMTFRKPPKEIQDFGGIEYGFMSVFGVDGLGVESDNELLLMSLVPENVCVAINGKLGNINPGGTPPLDGNSNFSYPYGDHTVYGQRQLNDPGDIGFFGGGTDISAAELFGKTSGCFQHSGSGNNIFYYVLAVR